MADKPTQDTEAQENKTDAQPEQEEKKAETQAEGQADKQAEAKAEEGGEKKGMDLDELDAPQSQTSKPPSGTGEGQDAGLEAVYDIPVRVSAVLGETQMEINKLLKLGRGAVVVLDRKIGEAIDIYVNERLVARGEVVIADEDKLGVTMTEIVKLPK